MFKIVYIQYLIDNCLELYAHNIFIENCLESYTYNILIKNCLESYTYNILIENCLESYDNDNDNTLLRNKTTLQSKKQKVSQR